MKTEPKWVFWCSILVFLSGAYTNLNILKMMDCCLWSIFLRKHKIKTFVEFRNFGISSSNRNWNDGSDDEWFSIFIGHFQLRFEWLNFAEAHHNFCTMQNCEIYKRFVETLKFESFFKYFWNLIKTVVPRTENIK